MGRPRASIDGRVEKSVNDALLSVHCAPRPSETSTARRCGSATEKRLKSGARQRSMFGSTYTAGSTRKL
eukprot:3715047-Prymnesium_polylepis.1